MSETEPTAEYVLVVDPDDVVEGMRRNARDRDEQRYHEFRFSRPLEGDIPGTLHSRQEGERFPPDTTAPLCLRPEAFVEDSDLTQYPESWQVYEAAKETAGVTELHDVPDQILDETWEVHENVWEDEVRANLFPVVDVRARSADPPEYARVDYQPTEAADE